MRFPGTAPTELSVVKYQPINVASADEQAVETSAHKNPMYMMFNKFKMCLSGTDRCDTRQCGVVAQDVLCMLNP